MLIHFYKYQGAGNDFVLIDNRDHRYDSIKNKEKITFLCHRRFGIGADGVMMIENKDGFDFEMIYYNSDGNPGSMCGNGGRCIVSLAHKLGMVESTASFNASDGPHLAKIVQESYIELKMSDVTTIDLYDDHAELNTGSPHYIKRVSNIAHYPVYDEGRSIRYSASFPNGINVNFISKAQDGYDIRTYERGVEDETWACGTGATAAALAIVEEERIYDKQELKLRAKGGSLKVKFKRNQPGDFSDIWLCGEATYVYEGDFNL